MTWCKDDSTSYAIRNSNDAIIYMIMACVFYFAEFLFVYLTCLSFRRVKLANKVTLLTYYISAHLALICRLLYLYGGLVCYHSPGLYMYFDYAQAYFRDSAYVMLFVMFIQSSFMFDRDSTLLKPLWLVGWGLFVGNLGVQHVSFFVYLGVKSETLVMTILLIGQFLGLFYVIVAGWAFMTRLWKIARTNPNLPNVSLYTGLIIYIFFSIPMRIGWNLYYIVNLKGRVLAWAYMIFSLVPDAIPFLFMAFVLIKTHSPRR
jgi:hypothetical protein